MWYPRQKEGVVPGRKRTERGIDVPSQVDVCCRWNAGWLSSDCSAERKLDGEHGTSRGVRIAIEDRFYSEYRFTATNATAIRTGIGDCVAVFAVNRMMQRDTAERRFRVHF